MKLGLKDGRRRVAFIKIFFVSLFSISSVGQLAHAAGISLQPSASSAIVLSPDERFLWSVNPDLDSVTVTRTDTNNVVMQIPVGDEPVGIALTPNGKRAYVANAADNSVTAIRIKNRKNINRFSASVDKKIGRGGFIKTGSEPRSVVVSPNGKMVFVANSSQDTITVLKAKNGKVKGSFDLRNSECNVGDRERHYQPRALAVTQDSRYLYVTRFLSFTTEEGVQRDDLGKEGVVCKLAIQRSRSGQVLGFSNVVRLEPQETGILDKDGNITYGFPNQLDSIVIRDGIAYLPNIGASPTGPQSFSANTQAFVNMIGDIGNVEYDLGAINLHLGGRDPEMGKEELYFANPKAIAFTKQRGQGFAYVAAAGSDILVKLNVNEDGSLRFTSDEDTTRYIDLNDPDNFVTSDDFAGKNPMGMVFNAEGTRAYVLNYVSRNISVVNLETDQVVTAIRVAPLPEPGSLDEQLLVGAEMFYSSRGNFVRRNWTQGSSKNRLSEKGRQNCASCHANGLTDGVIWQFASGPRKTLSVNGTFNPRDPSDQKIINASAIFDEVEDADFNTRLVSSAGLLDFPAPCIESNPVTGATESRIDPDHGLILGEWDNFEFAACVMNQFAKPNSNRAQPYVRLPGSDVEIKAHDALVDWQRYAVRTPNRPMTSSELVRSGLSPVGGLNDVEVAAGKRIYKEAGCDSCHSGGKWTISTKDFVSPPDPSEIATESGAPNANQAEFLYRFLRDIGSFNLNVAGTGNIIPGYPAIGGIETDTRGFNALGFDYNNDGKGSGYNVSSILGAYGVPPYYHNGACETLACVVADEFHRVAGLDEGEEDFLESPKSQRLLVKYLESIDEKSKIH